MTGLVCDVVIIGSGPAGMFAADQLLRCGRRVVMVERGRPMARRACPPGPGCDCRLCDVLEGDGGAGSFSDGKITLSGTRGTHGRPLFTTAQEAMLSQVDATIRRLVPDHRDYPPVDRLPALDGHAATGLRFEAYPLLHVGSDGIRAFGERFCAELVSRGLTLLSGHEATHIVADDRRVTGTVVGDRCGRYRHVDAEAVIVATGMAGTVWLENELDRLGIIPASGPADIGIRVETTAAALHPFIGDFYDFKIAHTSPAGITARSFCVNGHGFIVNEFHRPLGIRGVNGHSFLDRQSDQSNLAVMATIDTTNTPDPKAYVRTLARDINAATDGYPVQQRLAEFLGDRHTGPAQGVTPSNPKTRPGRLDLLLPLDLYEVFAGYLTALGAVLPPVLGADTVLYAPEIKYYNYRVPVDPATWESTDVAGLFVVGNAAGYTASLSAAALSGIIAGQALTTPAR